MTFLNDFRISTKIITLVLVISAVSLFLAWNGSQRLRAADRATTGLVTRTLPGAVELARVSREATEMVYAAYRTVSFDGRSADARAAAADAEASYRSARTRLAGVAAREPELAPRVAALADAIDDLHRLTAQAVAFGLANRNDDAMRVLNAANPKVAALIAINRQLTDTRTGIAKAQAAALTADATSTSRTLLITAIGSVIAGIMLSIVVTRSGITGPLVRLQEAMAQMAGGDFSREVEGQARGDEIGGMARSVQTFREAGIAKIAADAEKARVEAAQKQVVETVSEHLSGLSRGDLTASITADFPPEFATLKTNFNDALGKLRDLIGAVSETARTIRTGSGEIAQASEDLARRTEGSAASLEETAASVTQIDSRLKASAIAAASTVARADQAIATVGGGRTVADEAVQAMGRVADSAKGIDSVIEGLDKIAFQTRVLAMNAAVEAGRAGDAGRGFAVVADLVSALAMRSEEEAKRARDQLTTTQTDIVTAVEAVQKVDGALSAISDDVGQVHELLGTMATDNQAQSAAITQISAAIGTMDQATQQNAAMVEETSAAARNLAREVGGLTEQAAQFRIDGRDGARTQRTATLARVSAAPVAAAPAYDRAVDAGPVAAAPHGTPAPYSSPVAPLPSTPLPAYAGGDDDWNSF